MDHRDDATWAVQVGLAALASWRVTHFVARESGPGEVMTRIRQRLGTSLIGQLVDCFACASVWVAMPFALSVSRRRRDLAVVCLGLSGAACLLERLDRGGLFELAYHDADDEQGAA